MGLTEGTVESGFEPVRGAFEANFSERAELGAAFAVAHRGRLVVDLWGGVADAVTGRPWAFDRAVQIFSGTKALSAVCLLILQERGRLDATRPIARYWPEFAAGGKADVTVRDALVHRAGVPGLRETVGIHEVLDPESMAGRLASQVPIVPAGAMAYHAWTFGWICGELIRRIDGRSLGRFFADEVAEPFGLDAWIGIPDAAEGRVARLDLAPGWGMASPFLRVGGTDDTRLAMVWANPPLLDPERFPWNRPSFRRAEIASLNGIGTARSLALLMGSLARLAPTAAAAIAPSRDEGNDEIQGVERAYGQGFEHQAADRVFGRPPDAFGHTGAGGSIIGTWPGQSIGFAYLPNRLVDAPADTRRQALMEALGRCIFTVAEAS